MTKRLEILKNSLAKKIAIRDAKINHHFETVRLANGQPLNDKRNGRRTLNLWERQNESIRKANAEIEKTERAIEAEESKIARVENTEIPKFIIDFVDKGVLTQWRKFPNRFFVKGVEKGRIVLIDGGQIGYAYYNDIPTAEQKELFKKVYNDIRAVAK